jgi:hypothetical protein
VSPQTGSTVGGTAITITGANFQTGATVQIGNAAATNVVVAGGTQITCTTPPGSPGPKNVTVSNPDTFAATLAGGFTYVVPLVLTQVAPSVATPGTTITVTGSGIQPGATLSIGGISVTPASLSGTTITFANPAGVACDASLVVANPDGQSASLVFNRAPVVNAVFPPSGSTVGGNLVTVVGSEFHTGTSVTVNGAPVVFTLLSSTLMWVTMPASMAGPAQVVLTSMNGCTGQGTYTYF